MDHFGLIQYSAVAHGVSPATASDYCCLLDAGGCFDGLSMADAHTVALVVAMKICQEADCKPLRDDPDAVNRSLTIAAEMWQRRDLQNKLL